MKFYLAPLAGFTDAPFRKLCFEGGADLTYTEMVSAAGLAHGSRPTRHLMEKLEGEGPVACQLFGSNERDLAFAAREVPEGFVELNLNAGCPMTKVTREGAGAKLIEDPEKVYRLLKAMKENTSMPVSLKTRLGPRPDKPRIFELLNAAESAGVSSLIVHARFTSQMHGGATDLELLREVVEKAKVPIVGNGSVVDARTASEMAKTGVAAIMVGRAALNDPAIFSRLKNEESELLFELDAKDICRRHLRYLLEFREKLVDKYPLDHIPSVDGYASVKMHTHLFRYFNGRPGAAALRAKLNLVRTLREIYDIIISQ